MEKKKTMIVPNEFAFWLNKTTEEINNKTGYTFRPFQILKMMMRKIKKWSNDWIWKK